MKGKMTVIGTMEVEDETLDGAFVEVDRSELDSRFFGDVVVIKRESEYQELIEALVLAEDELSRWYSMNDIEPESTFAIKKIEEALGKAGVEI